MQLQEQFRALRRTVSSFRHEIRRLVAVAFSLFLLPRQRERSEITSCKKVFYLRARPRVEFSQRRASLSSRFKD